MSGIGRPAPQAVLLAVTGEDTALVRCLDEEASGLVVIRRCGDVAELLGAALANLATLAIVDTAFSEMDATVLARLEQAGVRGIVLTGPDEHFADADSWLQLPRGTSAPELRAQLQAISRSRLGGGAPAAEAIPLENVAHTWREPHFASAAAQTEATDAETPTAESLDAPEPAPASGAVVVVWGPQGAPGRSTIAAALAHILGKFAGSILVDADVQAPSLVQMLGLPEESSAVATAARLAAHGNLDAESLKNLLTEIGDERQFLSGLGRSGRWRELPPEVMAGVCKQCQELAAWTVIDVSGGAVAEEIDDYTLEPGPGALVSSLLASADVIVVVGGADPIGVRRLLQLMADLEQMNSIHARVEVVVNKVRASAAGAQPRRAVEQALMRFGGLQSAVLLPWDESADQALMQGVDVIEIAPQAPLAAALAQLADRIAPGASAKRGSVRSLRRQWRQLLGVKGRKSSYSAEPTWQNDANELPPPPPPPRDASASTYATDGAQSARRSGKHRA